MHSQRVGSVPVLQSQVCNAKLRDLYSRDLANKNTLHPSEFELEYKKTIFCKSIFHITFEITKN